MRNKYILCQIKFYFIYLHKVFDLVTKTFINACFKFMKTGFSETLNLFLSRFLRWIFLQILPMVIVLNAYS